MSDNLPRMDYRQHRRARRLVHECCNYDGGKLPAVGRRGALRVCPEHFPFSHVPVVPCGCPAPLTGN